MADEHKKKALEAALAQIDKQFGKGSIMRMDGNALSDIASISTGIEMISPDIIFSFFYRITD